MKLSSRQELLAEAEAEIKKIQKTLAKKRKLKESRTNLKEAVLHEGAWKYTGGHGVERRYKYKKTIGQAIQNSWWLSALKYVTGATHGMKPSDMPRITNIEATVLKYNRTDYGDAYMDDNEPATNAKYTIWLKFTSGVGIGSPSGPSSFHFDKMTINGDLLNPDKKPTFNFYIAGDQKTKDNSKLIQWTNTPEGKAKMDQLISTLVDELKRDTEVAHTYESKVPNRKARTNEASLPGEKFRAKLNQDIATKIIKDLSTQRAKMLKGFETKIAAACKVLIGTKAPSFNSKIKKIERVELEEYSDWDHEIHYQWKIHFINEDGLRGTLYGDAKDNTNA